MRPLLMREGRVAPEGEARSAEASGALPAYDASGCWVLPGLVDMHVHLRVPGGEASETLRSGLAAAVAGGFTTVAAMPNTDPPLDRPERILPLLEEASAIGLADLVPVACVTVERGGRELADMRLLSRECGVRAFSDDGDPVADSALLLRAMRVAADIGAVVIEHPEDRSLSAGGAVNLGRASELSGLPGIPPEAELVDVARCALLARAVPGRLHLTHVSLGGSLALLEALGATGLVSVDVTPHHLFLDELAVERHGPMAKMNPPLRSPEERMELLEALVSGAEVVRAVATDHAPHAAPAKSLGLARSAFGVTGLETALPLLLEHLYHGAGMEPLRLVGLLTTGPASVLGLEAGTLAEGEPADVTVVDPEAFSTLAERVSLSLSSNTPFMDIPLRGEVRAVWKEGRVVYREGRLA